jgi:hypothetical protein
VGIGFVLPRQQCAHYLYDHKRKHDRDYDEQGDTNWRILKMNDMLAQSSNIHVQLGAKLKKPFGRPPVEVIDDL